MSDQIFSLRSLALATCIVVSAVPVTAQQRAVRRQSVVIPFSQAETNRELYVAIMGSVSRPGTYHLDPSKLNLQTVVSLAGGLTTDSMTSIRLIRSGRDNQQITYSESVARSDFPLQPGDLLIVETKKPDLTGGQIVEFDRDPTTVRASYEEPAQPAGVQVALLNVLDYPVVFRFPSDDASPAKIIEMLGQEKELCHNYSVVGSNARNRGFQTASHSVPLTSASALVFDRNSVNRERLPKTLPRPIESDIEFGAQAGLIGNPSGQSQQLLDVGRRAFSSSNDARELPPIPPVPVERVPVETPSDNQDSELPPSITSRKPRIAELPFTGDAPISKSSRTSLSPFENETIESVPELTRPSIAAVPELSSAAPLLVEDEPAPPPAGLPAIPLVLAIGLLSISLVGIALLAKKRLPSKGVEKTIDASTESSPIEIPSDPTPVPRATDRPAPMTLLERMIKNQIPLTVEAVEFPSEIALQGKIVTKPMLRVDGPQDVLSQNGPHFASQEQVSHPTVHETIFQADGPESMPRRPHFIRSQKVPDLATAPSGQGPQSGGERSNAPLANALFELERGGRS